MTNEGRSAARWELAKELQAEIDRAGGSVHDAVQAILVKQEERRGARWGFWAAFGAWPILITLAGAGGGTALAVCVFFLVYASVAGTASGRVERRRNHR